MSNDKGAIYLRVRSGRRMKRFLYAGGVNQIEMHGVIQSRTLGRWKIARFEDAAGLPLDLSLLPEGAFFGAEFGRSDFYSRVFAKEKAASGEIRDEKGEASMPKSDEGGAGLPLDDCPEAWDSGL